MSKSRGQKLPKERNPFVEQMRARGKAVHGKNGKAKRLKDKADFRKKLTDMGY